MCLCARVSKHIQQHRYMYRHTRVTQQTPMHIISQVMLPFFVLEKGQCLSPAWNSLSGLGCLAMEPQGLGLFSPVLRIEPHTTRQASLTWVLGIKLKSWCLYGKYFMDWAISPHHPDTGFNLVNLSCEHVLLTHKLHAANTNFERTQCALREFVQTLLVPGASLENQWYRVLTFKNT